MSTPRKKRLSARQTNKLLEFGAAVREFRKQRVISQEKLAELADLHRTYVGSVERGERNISLDNILKLAEALDVHPSDFFDRAYPH